MDCPSNADINQCIDTLALQILLPRRLLCDDLDRARRRRIAVGGCCRCCARGRSTGMRESKRETVHSSKKVLINMVI